MPVSAGYIQLDEGKMRTMRTKKRRSFILAAAFLCVVVCFGLLMAKRVPQQTTLNVSLYRVIPDYDSFEKTVAECWKEIHPEVGLNFVDWDCYAAQVPEDLDVFVIDTTSLDAFVQRGYLLALPEEDIREYDDLISCFMEGSRVDGAIYVVPQMLCTDLLYTRKGDSELEQVQSLHDLYLHLLPEGGLLTDKTSSSIHVCMYLQALMDENQGYMVHYPPVEEGMLTEAAANALAEMRDMRQTEPGGVPEGSGWYYYAQRFAEGMGRAYIGYSEALDVMGEGASNVEFRLFSMTDGNDVPVYYEDAVAVNSHISEEKKPLALELLNLLSGRELMVKASVRDGRARYLLPARYSVYDALAADFPIYEELKRVVSGSEGYVFRIQPDGVAYMAEAEKHAEVLPSLFP